MSGDISSKQCFENIFNVENIYSDPYSSVNMRDYSERKIETTSLEEDVEKQTIYFNHPHEFEYMETIACRGIRNGHACLFEENVKKMEWEIVDDCRVGKFTVYKNGIPAFSGWWNEDGMYDGLNYVEYSSVSSMFVQCQASTGNIIYRGGMGDSYLIREGWGAVYNTESKPVMYGLFHNNALVRVYKRFIGDTMYEFSYGDDAVLADKSSRVMAERAAANIIAVRETVYVGGFIEVPHLFFARNGNGSEMADNKIVWNGRWEMDEKCEKENRDVELCFDCGSLSSVSIHMKPVRSVNDNRASVKQLKPCRLEANAPSYIVSTRLSDDVKRYDVNTLRMESNSLRVDAVPFNSSFSSAKEENSHSEKKKEEEPTDLTEDQEALLQKLGLQIIEEQVRDGSSSTEPKKSSDVQLTCEERDAKFKKLDGEDCAKLKEEKEKKRKMEAEHIRKDRENVMRREMEKEKVEENDEMRTRTDKVEKNNEEDEQVQKVRDEVQRMISESVEKEVKKEEVVEEKKIRRRDGSEERAPRRNEGYDYCTAQREDRGSRKSGGYVERASRGGYEERGSRGGYEERGSRRSGGYEERGMKRKDSQSEDRGSRRSGGYEERTPRRSSGYEERTPRRSSGYEERGRRRGEELRSEERGDSTEERRMHRRDDDKIEDKTENGVDSAILRDKIAMMIREVSRESETNAK